MTALRVLDLFSGIGGFSLGLERTGGFRTLAFCEIDPFCRRVLAKHWPGVPSYEDISLLSANRLSSDGIFIDVICGGFPCQDISSAGSKAGLAGKQSGLWRELCRLIDEVRPKFAIVENVSALLFRGLGNVLGDLAEIGYDAEWHCIPASAIGAPHRRDRIWIVAHPEHSGCERWHSARSIFGSKTIVSHGWWTFEPDVGRMADGIPNRMDRLRSLGNAIVPQIAEMIGRAILETGGLAS